MLHITNTPPLTLYVHFPWCRHKCPYCDFNSHQASADFPESLYIEALILDLERCLPLIWGRNIRSIFFGGGTPSLFSAGSLQTLLSAIRARLACVPELEVTLEANPGTLDAGDSRKLRDYREAGINRLSIGVQSFDNKLLKGLERIHGSEEAYSAIDKALAAGFDRINIDLMFGLPGQTPALARNDIETATRSGVDHISYYQLTLEPNTAFAHRPPPLPAEEAIWDFQQLGLEVLSAAGYQQYEVSAFAKKGGRCQHNLNYWRFGDYLGIGAGAHSKITDAQTQSITRTWKKKRPEAYIEACVGDNGSIATGATGATGNPAIEGQRTLGPQDLGLEFMMNALRLNEGIHPSLFTEHTGLPISQIENPLTTAENRGLINWTTNRISATETGRRYLNDLLELFLPEHTLAHGPVNKVHNMTRKQ